MKAEIFDARVCKLGEGPGWDGASGRVFWVDILASRILWRSLADGATGAIDASGHVGAAVLRKNGGFAAALPEGVFTLSAEGKPSLLARFPHASSSGLRANDAKADPHGALWVGTMAYDERPGAGALYRLDPTTKQLALKIDKVTISNGLGWSPDGQTMYYIDTPLKRIEAFDFAPSGAILNRRTFADCSALSGAPDGLCVDAEGGVWAAFWGGGCVRRFSPDGRLSATIELPAAQVTSCAFVGPALDRLVITTASVGLDPRPTDAGLAYIATPGVRGLPVNAFAG